MINVADLIANAPLRVVSGEGAHGTIVIYDGKRTERALKMRLTRERSGGQRWARIEAQHGDNWIRIMSGGDA